MKKEDKEFLIELQHELKTQTNDGNAAPVYWGVMDVKDVPCRDGYGNTTKILISNPDFDTFETDEFVNYIGILMEANDDENVSLLWNDVDKSDVSEVVDFANDHFDMDAQEVEFETKEFISTQTGCFLTKRECQNYIDKFGYNHNKPRTYAMTAYRNYELGRLLKILINMNMDDIKEDEIK